MGVVDYLLLIIFYLFNAKPQSSQRIVEPFAVRAFKFNFGTNICSLMNFGCVAFRSSFVLLFSFY